MGVDLKLLPFSYDGGSSAWSHVVLPLERRYELWLLIEALDQVKCPEDFSSYVCHDDKYPDGHYGRTDTNSYGGRLRYTTVEQLLTLADDESVKDNPLNRAAWAYLRELKTETKVALYWC